MNKEIIKQFASVGIASDSPEYVDIDKRVHGIVVDIKKMCDKGKLEFADTLKAVYDIAELVIHIIVEDKKIPKEEITPLVKELAHYIYFSPEALGDPNISWIPDWAEERIEHELIDDIVPFIVECIVKYVK